MPREISHNALQDRIPDYVDKAIALSDAIIERAISDPSSDILLSARYTNRIGLFDDPEHLRAMWQDDPEHTARTEFTAIAALEGLQLAVNRSRYSSAAWLLRPRVVPESPKVTTASGEVEPMSLPAGREIAYSPLNLAAPAFAYRKPPEGTGHAAVEVGVYQDPTEDARVLQHMHNSLKVTAQQYMDATHPRLTAFDAQQLQLRGVYSYTDTKIMHQLNVMGHVARGL